MDKIKLEEEEVDIEDRGGQWMRPPVQCLLEGEG